MEYIESEGIHAVGKCPHYAFIKTKLRGNCQTLQFILNGTGYGIQRYYQWQEENEYALALDLTVVADCIILQERLAIHI